MEQQAPRRGRRPRGGLRGGLQHGAADLVLGANSIGDAGASSIAEALQLCLSQPYASHASQALHPFLALHSFCTSPLTTLRFPTLHLQALKVNVVLHTLVLGSLLGGNNIGDRGAIAIAEALKMNVALQELYLSDGIIGDAGAMALAEGLKVNGVRSLYTSTRTSPRSLHLSLCHLIDRC